MDNWNPMKEDSDGSRHDRGSSRDSGDKGKGFVQLYVTGIPNGMNMGGLQSLFNEAGNVLEAKKMPSQRAELGTTYGFISYETEIEAERAVRLLNGREIGPHKLSVSVALSPEEKRQKFIIAKEREQMHKYFVMPAADGAATHSDSETSRPRTQSSTSNSSTRGRAPHPGSNPTPRSNSAFRPVQPAMETQLAAPAPEVIRPIAAPVSDCSEPVCTESHPAFLVAAIHGEVNYPICRHVDEARKLFQLTEYRDDNFTFGLADTALISYVNNLGINRLDSQERQLTVMNSKIVLQINRDREAIPRTNIEPQLPLPIPASTPPRQPPPARMPSHGNFRGTARPYQPRHSSPDTQRDYRRNDVSQPQVQTMSGHMEAPPLQSVNVPTPPQAAKDDAPDSTPSPVSPQIAPPQEAKSPRASHDTSDLMTFDDTTDDQKSQVSTKSDDTSSTTTTTKSVSKIPSTCACCGKTSVNMKKCKRCKTPYCDQVCQKKDWGLHQHNCASIVETNAGIAEVEATFDVSVGDDFIQEVGARLQEEGVIGHVTEARSDSGIESPDSNDFSLLTIGQPTKVVVTHVVDPGEIWVQVINPSETKRLYELLSRMCAVYATNTTPLPTPPQPGDVLAGLFSADQSWYRVRVERVIDDANVSVRFVDFGNVETVEAASLRLLSSDFTELRYQGVRCHLVATDSWTPEEATIIKEKIPIESIFVLEASERLENGYLVKLINEDGECINDLLRPRTPSNLNNVSEADCLVSPIREYTKPTFKPNESYKVLVKNVVSPREVWLQIYNPDSVKKSLMLNDSINQLCTNHPTALSTPPLVGDMYAAKHVDGDRWYRCVVLMVTADCDSCTVLYVDLGHKCMVATRDLRQLGHDMKDLDRQAICFGLSGVDLTNGKVQWSSSDKDLLQSTVTLNSLYTMTYVGNDDDVPQVLLYDEGRNLNDELVTRGCGTPPPDHPSQHAPSPKRPSQDPRSQDPRNQDPRNLDPRTQYPRNQDPRNQDPRNQDPRTQDPRNQDPRNQDPRNQDRMGQRRGQESRDPRNHQQSRDDNRRHHRSHDDQPRGSRDSNSRGSHDRYSRTDQSRDQHSRGYESHDSQSRNSGSRNSSRTQSPQKKPRQLATDVPRITDVLKPNQKVNLTIVEVTSPTHFTARLTMSDNQEAEQQKFFTEMNAHYDNAVTVPHQPTVGSLVVAKYSGDNNWYRGEVVGVAEHSADVCYIDYGNRENVMFINIREVGIRCVGLMCVATECGLPNINDDTKLSTVALELFQNTAVKYSEKSCPAIVSEIRAGKVFVDLVLPEGSLLSNEMVGVPNAGGDRQKNASDYQHSDGGVDAAEAFKREFLGDPKQPNADIVYQALPESGKFNADVIIGDNGRIYAHLSDAGNEDPYTKMLVSLNRHYTSVPKSQFTSKVDDIVVSKYENLWFRSVVTKILSPDQISVHYLDYGNNEDVSIDDIRELTPEFRDYPFQGVPCVLANVNYTKSTDIATKIRAFNNLGKLSVVKKVSSQLYEVELFTDDGESVNETLRKDPKYRDSTKLSSPPVDSPQKPQIPRKEISSPKYDPRGCEVTRFTEPAHRPSGASNRRDTPARPVEPVARIPFTRTVIGEAGLMEGNLAKVIMTHVNPSEAVDFYCQHYDGATIEEMSHMSEQMTKHWKDAPIPQKFSPQVTEICSSYCESYTQWYRAEILTLPSPTEYLVHYIDFGFNETVPLSNLRPLLPKYAKMPALAMRCSLSGLPADCKWGDKTKDELELMQASLHCSVVLVERKGSVHYVRMKDKDGHDVFERFDKMGLIVKSQSVSSDAEIQRKIQEKYDELTILIAQVRK